MVCHDDLVRAAYKALTFSHPGNAGVARTAVGELAQNAGVDQAKAFSLFGACTALGYLVGPLIGGYLAQPAQKYGVYGPWELFKSYPYLLPCSISTFLNILVVIACFNHLPETNSEALSGSKDSSAVLAPTREIEQPEHAAILSAGKTHSSIFSRDIVCCLAGLW